jgi:hypothetical protein
MWVLLFLPVATLASFLVTGPPGAPVLNHLGSANSFKESQLENASQHGRLVNTGSPVRANRTHDTESLASYFWLSDRSFDHKVSNLILSDKTID